MFFYGEVCNSDPLRATTMLQLHVITPSLLAYYFGSHTLTPGWAIRAIRRRSRLYSKPPECSPG